MEWHKWPANEITSILDFYIREGYCKKIESIIEQYEELLLSMIYVDDNIMNYVSNIIKNTKGMKMFLVIHSIFRVNINERSRDVFELVMSKLLVPTEKEVEFAHRKLSVPEEIMKKVAIFDPQLIGYARLYDNIKIEYGMRARNPINIIDAWSQLDVEIERRDLAAQLISNTKEIGAF